MFNVYGPEDRYVKQFKTRAEAEAEVAQNGGRIKELFLTTPDQQNYTSTHFDTPNYVAHMRLNDRVDAKGKAGLFVEELQSDRHQQGREHGYKEPFEQWIAYYDAGGTEVPIGYGRSEKQALDSIDKNWEGLVKIQTRKRDGVEGVIPDAPFRTSWPLQLFKRALRDAVADGKEWIGWTTGETQAARYDLSKQVDQLLYNKNSDGTYQVSAQAGGRGNMIGEAIPESKLADYVGKEVAQKMVDGKGKRTEVQGKYDPDSMTSTKEYMQSLSGVDLKVGGEGMKGFYDTMVPKDVAKYVKQWGAQVEKSRITPDNMISAWVFRDDDGVFRVKDKKDGADPSAKILGEFDNGPEALQFAEDYKGDGVPIWRVNITPQMREGIKKAGQALFVGGAAAVVAEDQLE